MEFSKEDMEMVIMDHYKTPRNYACMEDASIEGSDRNPLKGDELTIYFRIDKGNIISDVSFQGQGSALLTASASIMTTVISDLEVRKALEEIEATLYYLKKGVGDFCDDDRFSLKTVHTLPQRLDCALMSWNIASRLLMSYTRE